MPEDQEVPRWQQGVRPLANGPTWDAMTPKERRSAFVGDIVLAIAGAIGIALLVGYAGALFSEAPREEVVKPQVSIEKQSEYSIAAEQAAERVRRRAGG